MFGFQAGNLGFLLDASGVPVFVIAMRYLEEELRYLGGRKRRSVFLFPLLRLVNGDFGSTTRVLPQVGALVNGMVARQVFRFIGYFCGLTVLYGVQARLEAHQSELEVTDLALKVLDGVFMGFDHDNFELEYLFCFILDSFELLLDFLIFLLKRLHVDGEG